MATMAPAPTTTATITPPRSSHGVRDSWGYSEHQKESFDHDTNTTAVNQHEDSRKRHFAHQNGNTFNSSYHSGIELASRKMNSTEHTGGPTADDDPTSPYPELKPSPTIDGGSWGAVGHHQNGDENKRNSVAISEPALDDNSKWIHRDKLARIENEELQAAGIYIPRTRATSKQRRDRSRSAMRRGTDASENTTRSRKNSTAVVEPLVNTWDLRTPEEIAEEEANNAYFNTSIPTSLKGGSRIPVAKVSPAPAGGEHFDRTSWKASDSPEEDTPLTNQKTRSRSASMKGSDAVSVSGTITGARRSATDVSPKKNAANARKTSGQSKTGPTGRPKTRSGSTKESNGSISTRPSTRSGDLTQGTQGAQGTKAPEGDPPWLVNAYKPDPRLPPDQQLLPTVARRLQQEKWEKEGKFGDVYDKEFRPLNDNVMLKPLDLEKKEPADEEAHAGEDEWPLKEPAKSPRQGSSYSTMPKISDKPHTPLASPRTPVTPHAPVPVEEPPKPTPKPTPERVPPEPIEDSKDGCGCCVVM